MLLVSKRQGSVYTANTLRNKRRKGGEEGEKGQHSSQREAVSVGTGQRCAGLEGLRPEGSLRGWGCWERS